MGTRNAGPEIPPPNTAKANRHANKFALSFLIGGKSLARDVVGQGRFGETCVMRTRTFTGSGTRPGAFTLVELLVTITIVAILAGVIFQAVPNAIAKARASTCQGNMRQIGTLMITYAAEFNGKFPEAGQSKGWVSRLCEHSFPEYPKSADPDKNERYKQFFTSGAGKIFVCPSNKYAKENLTKSYLANGRITGVRIVAEPGTGTSSDYLAGNTGAFIPKPPAKINHPAGTILLVEQWDGRDDAPVPPKNKTTLWNANDVRYANVGDTSPEEAACQCHGKGRHYLFVDGHIEYHEVDPGLVDSESYDRFYKGL